MKAIDGSFSESALNQFFSEARSHLAAVESTTEISGGQLECFFVGVKQKIERAELLDRKEATEFNVFDIIAPDENKVSDVVALMLDPRGVHGQGDLFLRLLIERVNAGLNGAHTKRALVKREALTDKICNNRRRIDVLVDFGDIIAIENKLFAPESGEQVKDYIEHLRSCMSSRSVKATLIYLSPHGRPPDSLNDDEMTQHITANRLRCWKYGKDLRDWLMVCRERCEAPRFRDFISDFIGYIERTLTQSADYDQ